MNSSHFDFSPDATGLANTRALQAAVDQRGTIEVTRPGTYRIAGTVYLGSHTALRFSPGVVLQKVDEADPFSHVLLNKGALTKTYDQDISVDGLTLAVNGLDVREWQVFGLHGQIAFFYIRDLRITRFRCYDLGRWQYGIHICTFEDIVVDDVIIHGDKDGVHLGRGKRFRICNGVFKTADDAIALNAHDYDVGNPELGWIESGVVENCHDLHAEKTKGYFARILGGAWTDWRAGMEVQKSDTVVSAGRLYRVKAQPDGVVYRSLTPPTHEHGAEVLDGITWVMVQTDVTYTAGVRDVVFRDIFLAKPRLGFSVHFDNDKFSRSYYPGAPVPRQERLLFDNVRVLHGGRHDFLCIGTPMDALTLSNCVFGDTPIHFHGNRSLPDYGPTSINLIGCTYPRPGAFDLVLNEVPGKRIHLKTTADLALHDDFTARIVPGPGEITVNSSLPVSSH
jgi:hypothetical protein